MPYELFWHLNPTKIKPFKLSYKKKLEQENQNAWLQGIYIQSAIKGALFGKKAKYPDKPFGTEAEANDAAKESPDITAKRFDAFTKIYNRRFDKG